MGIWMEARWRMMHHAIPKMISLSQKLVHCLQFQYRNESGEQVKSVASSWRMNVMMSLQTHYVTEFSVDSLSPANTNPWIGVLETHRRDERTVLGRHWPKYISPTEASVELICIPITKIKFNLIFCYRDHLPIFNFILRDWRISVLTGTSIPCYYLYYIILYRGWRWNRPLHSPLACSIYVETRMGIKSPLWYYIPSPTLTSFQRRWTVSLSHWGFSRGYGRNTPNDCYVRFRSGGIVNAGIEYVSGISAVCKSTLQAGIGHSERDAFHSGRTIKVLRYSSGPERTYDHLYQWTGWKWGNLLTVLWSETTPPYAVYYRPR